MFEKKEKSPKAPKKDKGNKKLDMSIIAISDNIIFSEKEIWAFYKITDDNFDFRSKEAKIGLAMNTMNAMSEILGERAEPLECEVINTFVPLDIDSWEVQMEETTEGWNRGPGFDAFIENQKAFMENERFSNKVTYLGVMLSKRGEVSFEDMNPIESGVKGSISSVKKMANNFLQINVDMISEFEETRAKKREEDVRRTLKYTSLQGEPMTAEDILLLIKRMFYPAMPLPYLDVDHGKVIGPGDIALEVHSGIENKLRYLKFNQLITYWNGEENVTMEAETFRAAITIAKLPKNVDFPYTYPFMYLLDQLNLDISSYARFTLMPSAKMKKELEKKKKDMKDELVNYSQGTGTTDSALNIVSTNISEAHQDLQEVNAKINSNDRMPWVEGTYRFIIEGTSEEYLKEVYTLLKDTFSRNNIVLNWTIGDQSQLFLEQMPGDHLREDSYRHLTDLPYFATSGWNFSSEVGDEIFQDNRTVMRSDEE